MFWMCVIVNFKCMIWWRTKNLVTSSGNGRAALLCLPAWWQCVVKEKWIKSSWADCHFRWFSHTGIRPGVSPLPHFWYNWKPTLPSLFTYQDWACSGLKANGVSGQSPTFVVPGLISQWTALRSVWTWADRFGVAWSTDPVAVVGV
jgi:hypothetical protein